MNDGRQDRRSSRNPWDLEGWMKILPLLLLGLGILLLAMSLATGGSRIEFFIIIPFIVAEDIFSSLGILLVIVGLLSRGLDDAGFSPFPKFGRDPRQNTSSQGQQFYHVPQEGMHQDSGYTGQVQPPLQQAPVQEKRKVGGVIFIGPIPIVFGSDAKTTKQMMVLGLVIALILLGLSFL